MTEELKPVPCGCGGEATCYMTHYWGKCFTVQCSECGIETKPCDTEAEAVMAWNKAMGADQFREVTKKIERTAKVIEHDASVTDTDGYKYHRSEYLCGACKKKVLGGDDYCSHCGARLEWE